MMIVVVVVVRYCVFDVCCLAVCLYDEPIDLAKRHAGTPRLRWRCFAECDDHVRVVLVCYLLLMYFYEDFYYDFDFDFDFDYDDGGGYDDYDDAAMT